MDITGLNLDSIPTLAMGMSQANILRDVNTSLLGMTLDVAQVQSAEMTKMMEQSVNPAVGGNIDISV